MSLILHLATAASEAVPLATGTGPTIPWGRLILAFLFCIVIAIGAIAFIRMRNGLPVFPDEMRRRMGQAGSTDTSSADRLQITQRLSVSPTSQLVVLKRGKQNYLLHLTNTGATEIDRFIDGETDKPE